MYRRNFIKTAATGFALTVVSGKLPGCNSSNLSATENIKEFGLQLYTLRSVLPNDTKGVLKKVAEMGYKQIESYEHDELGMFWGMKNTEFKKYLDDLGMQIISSHCNINKDFEKKAAEAAEIGMKYLAAGSLDNENDMDKNGYKKAADLLNKKGEICKSNGCRFAYHNHDYTFKRLENQTPQNILLDNTDKDLVDFEMDIYWVVTAGQDPVEWLTNYPDRFKLVHIKDRKKNASPSERETFSMLGKGSVNFPSILKAAKQKGVQYFLVEQDETYDTPVMQAIKENADYLKKLKI